MSLDLHLEHYDEEIGKIMRGGSYRKDIEGVMKSSAITFDKRPALAAWIYEDAPGRVAFESGKMVAVYTAGEGWHELREDPRPWWESLSREAQAGLLEAPGHQVPSQHVLEVTEAGAAVTSAAFVESEGEGKWRLTRPMSVFVQSVPYRRP